MENYDQYEGVAGSIPEFGAIFMSNLLTKKECFERKIFALPHSKADFVKHIKIGMVLFLFESNTRHLFGVFRASSDGAMDIVPHAFNYSRKRFPAQVRFKPIWYCDPLSEREFRDAIIENYFSAKKFNFGLSEDQVRRLMLLFSSRKRNKAVAHLPLPKPDIRVPRKDKRLVGDTKFESSERFYTGSTENDDIRSFVYPDLHGNSLVKEVEVLMNDRVNTDGIAHPLVQGDFLSQKRKVDDDNGYLVNDVANIYNDGFKRNSHTDNLTDSLDELRKLAIVRKFLKAERVRKENEVDKIRNAVLPSESFMIPLDVRADGDDKFLQRERLLGEYEMESDSGSVLYGKHLETCKKAVDHDNFQFDDFVYRNHDIRDRIEPEACGDGSLNLRRQALQVMEDNHSSFSAHEHDANLLNRTREPTSGDWITVDGRIPCGPHSSEDLSFAKSSQALHHVRSYKRKYPRVDEHMSMNMGGATYFSTPTSGNAGYFTDTHGRVVDDAMFRTSKGLESENDIQACIGNISLDGFPFPVNQTTRWSACSDKFLQENMPSQLNITPSFAPSHVTFDDTTITRSTPYSPEHPGFYHKSSRLVREILHHGSEPYKNRLDLNISNRSLDIPHEFSKNEFPTNVSLGKQNYLSHEATSSSLNNNLPMHLDRNASGHVDHKAPLFSESFRDKPDASRKNIEKEDDLSYRPSKSSHHRFAFADMIPTASQHTSEPPMQQGTGNSKPKKSTSGISLPERQLPSYEDPYFGNPSYMNHQVNCGLPEAPHLNSNAKRKSVFSRLTSVEQFRGDKERDIESKSSSNCRDFCMDATADEVMEMLRQNNNLPLKKLMPSSRVVKKSKLGRSVFDENQAQIHTEIITTAMECKKVTGDEHLAFLDENITELLKETRGVDFKRRSQTRRNLVGFGSDSTTCNNEKVGNSMKTISKRRKLVRPIFGKVESATNMLPVDFNGKQVEQNCEAEKLNDITGPNKPLVSHDSMDCSMKKHLISEEQNEAEAHVLPSSSNEPEEPKTLPVGIHVEAEKPSDIIRPNSTLVTDCSRVEEHLIPEEQNDAEAHVLLSSSNEPEEPRTLPVGIHGIHVKAEKPSDIIRPNSTLAPHNRTDCSRVEEHSIPEQQNDAEAHVSPSSIKETEEPETSTVGIHDEAEKPSDVIRPNNTVVSHNCADYKAEEQLFPEEQNDAEAPVLPSSSTEPESPKRSTVGIHDEAEKQSDIIRPNSTIVPHNCADFKVEEQLCPEEQNDVAAHMLPSSSNEPDEIHITSTVGPHVEAEKPNDTTEPNSILISHGFTINSSKKHLTTEEQNYAGSHMQPPLSSNEPEEHKSLTVALHSDSSSQAPLTETTPRESVSNIQTCVEFVPPESADSTSIIVNSEEQLAIGSSACSDNVNVEAPARPRMVKRKKKIVRKVIKTKKTGPRPGQ